MTLEPVASPSQPQGKPRTIGHASPVGGPSGSDLQRRLLGAARSVAWLAAAGVAYLGLRTAFVHVADHQGLLSPDGAVSLATWLLGLAVLGLRLGLLFLVPGVVAYRATTWLSARAFGQRRERAPRLP